MHNLIAICNDVERLDSLIVQILQTNIREEIVSGSRLFQLQTENSKNASLLLMTSDVDANKTLQKSQNYERCLVCVTVEDAFSKSIWNKVELIQKQSSKIAFLFYVFNLEDIDSLYHLQVPEKLNDLIKDYKISNASVLTSLQTIDVIRTNLNEFIFDVNQLINSEKRVMKEIDKVNDTYAESENSPAFEHRMRCMIKDAYANVFSRNFSAILNYKFCKKSLNSQEKIYRWIDNNLRVQTMDESSIKKTVENHLLSERETLVHKLKHRLISRGEINEKGWYHKVVSKEALFVEKLQFGAREISLDSQSLKKLLSSELMVISSEFEKLKRKKIVYTFLGAVLSLALLAIFPSVLFTLLAKVMNIEVQAGDLLELIKAFGDLSGTTYLIIGILSVFYIIILYEINSFVLNSKIKSKLEKRTRKIYEKVEVQVAQTVEEDVKAILSKVSDLKQAFIEDYVNCLNLEERE